jgi:hypothetical protein
MNVCKKHINNCACFKKGHQVNLGRKCSDEKKQKLRGVRSIYGGKPTKHDQKYFPTGLGFPCGKNHWNWQGGKSTLNWAIRNLHEYKVWRKQVFYRDSFTCQMCGEHGERLEAHHKIEFILLLKYFLGENDQFSPIEDKEVLVRLAIKYKPFWNIENGLTLCKKCHKNTKLHNKGSLVVPSNSYAL